MKIYDPHVYVVLDTSRPGQYVFSVGKRVHEFSYEPIYVGKGIGPGRKYAHAIAALATDSPRGHKERRIVKIYKEGFETLELRVRGFKTEELAFSYEQKTNQGHRQTGY